MELCIIENNILCDRRNFKRSRHLLIHMYMHFGRLSKKRESHCVRRVYLVKPVGSSRINSIYNQGSTAVDEARQIACVKSQCTENT